MFKNEEYSSFFNIFICLVLKHDKFTSFISLFRPLGYPIKPRPKEKCQPKPRVAGTVPQQLIRNMSE